MTDRTITASILCDSCTVQAFADKHHGRVKLTTKPDGRALFTIVDRFGQARGLLSHIFRVEEEQCHSLVVRR